METIKILPSKKWLKEIIVGDSVAKEAIEKHISKKAKASNRVKFLTRDDILKLFPKVFKQTIVAKHHFGLLITAKKGFDLYKIFPKTF
jgi:hypothetical protein